MPSSTCYEEGNGQAIKEAIQASTDELINVSKVMSKLNLIDSDTTHPPNPVSEEVHVLDLPLPGEQVVLQDSLEKTKPFAILRYFNDPSLKYPSQVLMSAYMLDGISHALEKIQNSEKMYCVNVMYELDPTGKTKDMTGDMQLFTTGTIEQKESPLMATLEELKEEIRMEPVDEKYIENFFVKSSHRQTIHWLGCNVKYLKPASNIAKRTETSTKRKDKIVCILYGTHSEIVDFLNRIPPQNEKNGENISGLICMNMTDIAMLCSIINSTACYKKPFAKFHWMNDRTHKKAFNGRYFPAGLLGTI